MFGKGVFCESRLWECRVSLSFLGSRISFPFQLRNSVKAIGRDKSKHYLSKWPVVKLSGISPSQEPTSFHQQCWEQPGKQESQLPLASPFRWCVWACCFSTYSSHLPVSQRNPAAPPSTGEQEHLSQCCRSWAQEFLAHPSSEPGLAVSSRRLCWWGDEIRTPNPQWINGHLDL